VVKAEKARVAAVMAAQSAASDAERQLSQLQTNIRQTQSNIFRLQTSILAKWQKRMNRAQHMKMGGGAFIRFLDGNANHVFETLRSPECGRLMYPRDGVENMVFIDLAQVLENFTTWTSDWRLGLDEEEVNLVMDASWRDGLVFRQRTSPLCSTNNYSDDEAEPNYKMVALLWGARCIATTTNMVVHHRSSTIESGARTRASLQASILAKWRKQQLEGGFVRHVDGNTMNDAAWNLELLSLCEAMANFHEWTTNWDVELDEQEIALVRDDEWRGGLIFR